MAIDASLGQKKHLGYVTIGNGALYPGAAVQKELPPVGDIHITGIVNTAGIMEQLTLQTTRLSTVIQSGRQDHGRDTGRSSLFSSKLLFYTKALICL